MKFRTTLALVLGLGVEALAANDLTVRIPPLYDTLMPPAVGGNYTDRTFGVRIKRASDARRTTNNFDQSVLTFVSTEYPTAAPFNSDNTRLLLQHQGYFGLYDGAGTYIQDLPFAANAATEPRWSRTDPNILYYVNGNSLRKLNVTTGVSTTIRAFPEYAAIRGRGESDISRDGDHFVFAADEPAGPSGPGLANRYVFVYTISTNTKGVVLDTSGHGFNQLYLAPDNSVAIGWLATGTARFSGVELFNSNMVFERQLTRAIGHMHLTRDTNGDDLLIWTNSNDPAPIANCQNGIVKIRLSNAQQTCLLPLDWSLAVHITAPDGNGWAFVETYDPADPPSQVPAWKLYTNEVLQVKLDGTEVRRLFHHRSRQTAQYGYQPRATVSRDGTKLVFTSNYNLQAILGNPSGYTDAYLVDVPARVPPRLSIADASVFEGNGGTRNLVFNVSLTTTSDLAISAVYTTANLGAVSPQDYVPASGVVTFAPGETAKTICVTVNGDTEAEADESVSLTLSEASNVVVADGVAVGRILNDDPPAPLFWTELVGVTVNGNTLVRASGAAAWNAGAISKEVLGGGDGYLDFGLSETTTYRMIGLGKGNTDQGFSDIEWAVYLTGSGTFMIFESGVAKTNAAPYSSGDRFRVGVESGQVKYRRNGVLVYTSAVAPQYPLLADTSMYTPGGTITDARLLGFAVPPIAISIDDQTAPEGDTGARPSVFTLRLSRAADAAMTVDWMTVDGTAVAPADYQAAFGTVAFDAGDIERTLSVQVVGDVTPEPREQFIVSLSNPTGGSVIADGQGTGTILDTDGSTDKSRLMFHNFVTNRLYRWHMKNGNTLDTYNWVTPWATDPGWTVGAVADFDQDGQLDYLWHNVNDGRLLFWYIDGDNLKGYQFLTYQMGPPWRVATSFDANDDAAMDVVYYNAATGVVRVVLHDNGTTLAQYDLNVTLPASSPVRVVNAADVNGDGRDDLLLYNSVTGRITAWVVNGPAVVSTLTYPDSQVASPAYTLVSTRTDFNGDGVADLLWHNPAPTGVFSVWFMNGTTRLGTGVFQPFTATDPVWRVVGSANIWP